MDGLQRAGRGVCGASRGKIPVQYRKADAVMGCASAFLLLYFPYGGFLKAGSVQQVDGHRGKPARLRAVLCAACLRRIHGGGRRNKAGNAALLFHLPCMGLWERGDFRRDVYPHVPVAYGFYSPVYGFAPSGGKEAGLPGAFLFAAGVPYGVSWIFNPVLLYYFPFFPGSRVLLFPVKE